MARFLADLLCLNSRNVMSASSEAYSDACSSGTSATRFVWHLYRTRPHRRWYQLPKSFSQRIHVMTPARHPIHSSLTWCQRGYSEGPNLQPQEPLSHISDCAPPSSRRDLIRDWLFGSARGWYQADPQSDGQPDITCLSISKCK